MVHLHIATKQEIKYKFHAVKLAYFLQITDFIKKFIILIYFYHNTPFNILHFKSSHGYHVGINIREWSNRIG
jgi:hypothetical protein